MRSTNCLIYPVNNPKSNDRRHKKAKDPHWQDLPECLHLYIHVFLLGDTQKDSRLKLSDLAHSGCILTCRHEEKHAPAAVVLLSRVVDSVKGNVDIPSVSPCANTEISTGGVLPPASALLHFNILSAIICSPRLTHYVSLSLLTLPHNSPKSPASHLRGPTPSRLRAPSPYLQPPALGLSETIIHHFAARLWPPFYLLISSFLLRCPTAALDWKPRETFALLKNNQRTSSCTLSPFWRWAALLTNCRVSVSASQRLGSVSVW